jgi:phage-related protein
VRYAEAIFVLHAFQKKSKKGVATPKMEIDSIKKRLRNLIEEREERR